MMRCILYFIIYTNSIFSTNINTTPCIMVSNSITVLDNKYKIPEFWESRKIDKNLQANSNDLIYLPSSLTYKNYNIYVTKKYT